MGGKSNGDFQVTDGNGRPWAISLHFDNGGGGRGTVGVRKADLEDFGAEDTGGVDGGKECGHTGWKGERGGWGRSDGWWTRARGGAESFSHTSRAAATDEQTQTASRLVSTSFGSLRVLREMISR